MRVLYPLHKQLVINYRYLNSLLCIRQIHPNYIFIYSVAAKALAIYNLPWDANLQNRNKRPNLWLPSSWWFYLWFLSLNMVKSTLKTLLFNFFPMIFTVSYTYEHKRRNPTNTRYTLLGLRAAGTATIFIFLIFFFLCYFQFRPTLVLIFSGECEGSTKDTHCGGRWWAELTLRKHTQNRFV